MLSTPWSQVSGWILALDVCQGHVQTPDQDETLSLFHT